MYGWFLLPVSAICARYEYIKALYWDGVMAAIGFEDNQDNIVHYLNMFFSLFQSRKRDRGSRGDRSTTGMMGKGRIAKLVNHGLSDVCIPRRPWSEPKRT